MHILETNRLILRQIAGSDGEFMLNLLNQPSFIKYIGDRNVRSIAEAESYIESRFTKSYAENGFGLYLVELKPFETPIGICGFVKRDNFPHPDIGFAFLPEYEKQGFAYESAEACMNYGVNDLGFTKILAITTQDNENSRKLLEKIGLKFESLIEMSNNEILKLYTWGQ